jgi:hypothetical protein
VQDFLYHDSDAGPVAPPTNFMVPAATVLTSTLGVLIPALSMDRLLAFLRD